MLLQTRACQSLHSIRFCKFWIVILIIYSIVSFRLVYLQPRFNDLGDVGCPALARPRFGVPDAAESARDAALEAPGNGGRGGRLAEGAGAVDGRWASLDRYL